jgi:Asp-tRNA(Asn)/Glu-tRNA(Gln) amidotransferase A subunit family amidase
MESALWRLTAMELASEIAEGRLGAVEIGDTHLARITAVNRALNAITHVLGDSALEAAGCQAESGWLSRAKHEKGRLIVARWSPMAGPLRFLCV